ncbi:MAG: hypothetical protein AB7O57_00765 [Hyphomicrobiaceae bacterium]
MRDHRSPAANGALLLAALLGILAALVWTVAASAEARSRWYGFEVQAPAGTPPAPAIITYRGEIAYPFADNLADIWAGLEPLAKDVVLDLDSPGGELAEAEKAIRLIADMRRWARVTTRVRHGTSCLSACALVFAQGEERIAGGSSAWMFHGACGRYTNVPSPEPTRRYIAILETAGVAASFLCRLGDEGRLSRPGKFWSSGYELLHVHKAGLVTRLLESWQPETAIEPPFDPQVRSR